MNQVLISFYMHDDISIRSCLLALRDFVSNADQEIKETVKYGMPCYTYQSKPFCYIWIDRTTSNPYLLLVDGCLISHPKLMSGKRKRMKIFQIDPSSPFPIKELDEILIMALAIRK